jgi:lipopolysaccharide export system protein LptA
MTLPADPMEVIRTRDAEIKRIEGFADLTEAAKTRRKNEVRAWADQEYAKAKEEEQRLREENYRSSWRAVYDIPTGHA